MTKNKFDQYYKILPSFHKSLPYLKMVYANMGAVEDEDGELCTPDYTLFDVFYSLLVASLRYEGFVFRDPIKGPLSIDDLAVLTFAGNTDVAEIRGETETLYESFKLDQNGKLSTTSTVVTRETRRQEIQDLIDIGAITKIRGHNGSETQYGIASDIDGLELTRTTPQGFRQWKYRQRHK